MADDLTEPLKAYNDFLKDRVMENTTAYFDQLTQKSGIDVQENIETVRKYKGKLNEIDYLKKKVSSTKTFWRVFIILSGVLAFFGLPILYYGYEMEEQILFIVGIIVLSVGLIGLITFISIRLSYVRKKLKPLKESINDNTNQSKELLDKAYLQMAPLNALYDWNIPAMIINKSNDLIKMDMNLNRKRFMQLYNNYGLRYDEENDTSTVFVQSGEIYGNPFVICKDFRQSWTQKQYSNSITIHWTTTISTKDGIRTIHHSQTLTATVTKPYPVYNYVTYLMYGNDAAPNLIFSRGPSGASGLTEKKLNKMVKKESKMYDKKAEKALMDNDPTTNYQRFGNDLFESLFDGTNRNNEVEFRLLFTPLAQKNLIQLIKEPKPYGDDWYFNKDKMLNYVQSIHSQYFNYTANPNMFIDYSYEAAKYRFIKYMEDYFQSFYYDLLPIISIPIYQMNRSHEDIYKDVYKDNITCYEQEVMANSFERRLFSHPDSATDAILKVHTENNNGNTDVVKVTAYSYQAIPKVEYINKVGGDGRVHTIPVHYYIYEPLEKENYMAVGEKPSSRKEYLSAMYTNTLDEGIKSAGGTGINSYQRGLFAYILGEFMQDASVDKAFKTNGNKVSTAQEILKKEIEDIEEAINKAKDGVDNSNISNNNNTGSN